MKPKVNYVIGFELKDGRIEIAQEGITGNLEHKQGYFDIHYRIYPNAHIYKLIKVTTTRKP